MSRKLTGAAGVAAFNKAALRSHDAPPQTEKRTIDAKRSGFLLRSFSILMLAGVCAGIAYKNEERKNEPEVVEDPYADPDTREPREIQLKTNGDGEQQDFLSVYSQ